MVCRGCGGELKNDAFGTLCEDCWVGVSSYCRSDNHTVVPVGGKRRRGANGVFYSVAFVDARRDIVPLEATQQHRWA